VEGGLVGGRVGLADVGGIELGLAVGFDVEGAIVGLGVAFNGTHWPPHPMQSLLKY